MNVSYDDLHLSYLVSLCLTCCHNVTSIAVEILLVKQHTQSAFIYPVKLLYFELKVFFVTLAVTLLL